MTGTAPPNGDPNPPVDPPGGPPNDLPPDPPGGDNPPQDPPADPPSGDTPPADGAPAPKKKTAEDRIKDLIAERNATTEYADYWREQALAARAQGPKPPEPIEKPRPKLADFKDQEKWADALVEWSEDRIERGVAKSVETESTKTREAADHEAAVAAHRERVSKFAEKTPDYVATVRNPNLNISKTMTEVIIHSEKGPELSYHLGTHPAEAARIARMAPALAAAALGRIEATLGETPPPTKPKKPSNAPEPPNPLHGGGAPDINLETCSLNEFLDRRLGRKK
jgi:hypothetical protein